MLVVWRRDVAALRAEIGRERAAARALDDVRAEHARLRAAQSVAGESEHAAAGGAVLEQARAEVESLRRKVAASARAEAEKKAAAPERFAVGRTEPAAEWKNAGTATPAAALETALWAGAGGDVAAFAKTILLLNERTRRDAQALLDSLPEATRSLYGSPEQLIAFLSIKDVPLGAVRVRQSSELPNWPAPAWQMQVQLTAADGKQRDANLLFMNPGDGWKLVVLEGVVAKYAAQLKSPVGAAGGK